MYDNGQTSVKINENNFNFRNGKFIMRAHKIL